MVQEKMASIRRFLSSGQEAQALAELEQLLGRTPDDYTLRLLRAVALRGVGRMEDAVAAFQGCVDAVRGKENAPYRSGANYGLGLTYIAMKQWDRALDALLAATKDVPPDAETCSGICLAYSHLGVLKDAEHWGRKLLAMRDDAATCDPADVISRARPKAFDPDAPARNIVAYSLFGPDRFYHECAVTIARTTPVTFPEFTSRFYCAPDVPKTVLQALSAAKAQVLMVNAAGQEQVSPFAGTFWRFLPFDDPNVDVVLVRDVDSPVLPRERAAIDLWLESDYPFYCLRDHPVHAELMLAGMWGGFTGLLAQLGPLAGQRIRADRSKFADQRFLRDVIWPRIRDVTLSIDSTYSVGNTVDYPAGFPARGPIHVGMSWSRQQILGKG